MVKGHEVLEMLIPSGGWVMNGEDYSGIKFLECAPITEEQFEKGKLDVPAWIKAKADAKIAEEAAFLKDRADGLAKLEAVGLTAAQARAVARKDK